MSLLRLTAAAVVTGLWVAAWSGPALALDRIFLRNGGHVSGELQDAQLTLSTPHALYRVTRDTVWQIVLGAGVGDDAVALRNGNQLSGTLDQGRYTLRLETGETRVLDRGEIDVITLGAPSPPGAGLRDALLLANGDHVYGDVQDTDFDLVLPSGSQRFGRDAIRKIVLRTVVGDSLYLANGDRLSGVVSHADYTVRTPDGQILSFARGQVDEVVLRPRGPAAGPPPAPAAPAPAPGPAAPAPGPPPAAAAPPPAAQAAPAPAAPGLPAALREALRDIHFAFDRWDLNPEARQRLEMLATAMKEVPALRVLIEGHADERGTVEYNLALGERRAAAARAYLVNLGIDPTRLDTISYGEERPLDPGHNETAWALNRRAHFVVRSP